MYTLKIKWQRHEGDQLVDESTMFIPADSVTVHSEVTDDEQMKSWPSGSFLDYRPAHSATDTKVPARLIAVDHAGSHTVYLATLAWLLGPDGRTIERIAP